MEDAKRDYEAKIACKKAEMAYAKAEFMQTEEEFKRQS